MTKKLCCGMAALMGVAAVCGTALGQGAVVAPNAFANAQGESGLNTIMRNAGAPRSYQMIHSASELGGIPAGAQIVGLSWRIWFGAGAAWPPAQADWDDWEVRVSTPQTTAATMSTVFADNTGANEVLVRSGALSIPAGHFSLTTQKPNPFGDPAIMFSTPFVYTGGDILFDIRHPGGVHGFADGFLEVVNAPGAAGAAISASTFTPTTGAAAGLYVTEIHWIPTPATTALLALGGLLACRRRR